MEEFDGQGGEECKKTRQFHGRVIINTLRLQKFQESGFEDKRHSYYVG